MKKPTAQDIDLTAIKKLYKELFHVEQSSTENQKTNEDNLNEKQSD